MQYVLLMNLTDQGAKEAKDNPRRIAEGIAAFEKMGGTLQSFHVTMGAYDYVAVGDCPSDEAAAAFSLGLASSGRVKTTTLRAFTPEQIAPVCASIS
jgi:uncharacterized protein with GYD domain